ncbi:MAG: FUSC family protein [Gammaproteobacteria bacterium]|nr:FUSC family protein [Gammaproteobacteria bacterium]
MSSSKPSSANKSGIWEQVCLLLQLSEHKRPLGAHVTVALSVGGPVVIGVWFDNFSLGVVASLGGLVSLYLRQTPLSHRMVTMALVTFGFCASFTLSLLAGFNPWVMVAALGFVAFWATFICRYFSVPPPASLFFIMVACVASAMPFDLSLLAPRAGLLLFGCMGASALALVYSLVQLLSGHTKGVHPAEPIEPRVVAILLESATIAVFIAASYLLALWLGIDKPYWAPISCAAILQGASFRAVWHRKVHRVVGTAIGMGLTWVIFSFNPGPWTLALLLIALSFVVEILVTRNYGFAVIFITPLTIILAEAESASLDIDWLIQLRMIDVLLGSTVGYLGGWLLHQQSLYDRLEQRLLRLRGID